MKKLTIVQDEPNKKNKSKETHTPVHQPRSKR
mgnify:CR=1 FL=1